MRKSPDPIQALGEAYELLLEKTLDELHIKDARQQNILKKDIQDTINKAAQNTPQLQSLDDTLLKQIQEAVHRDLHSAGQYFSETTQEVKDWLGFELQLVEGSLLNLLPKIADQTTVGLLEWKQDQAKRSLHTGEIAGPGILVCDSCGEQLQFHRAGHIPPCAHCSNTVFHRLSNLG
ncbi:hypothetical protein MNBD_GAMMA23-453 [hydrothermal vent metagenome]|uniref:Zinc ribbon-containing protein n=1 Tax=hydrothermal vent metagenome TaxID=652676 RepID=A0A3B0ZTR3_9ZZZZ